MIKLYITYFYNIRNFTSDMIPFSTAIWDPKWYHDFKGNNHAFIDDNGVINGLRIEYLNPGYTNSCGCPCDIKDPCNCKFIKDYRKGLDTLDLSEVLNYIESFLNEASEILKLLKDDLKPVLIVHEADWNPCSERDSLIDYFTNNGIKIEQLKF